MKIRTLITFILCMTLFAYSNTNSLNSQNNRFTQRHKIDRDYTQSFIESKRIGAHSRFMHCTEVIDADSHENLVAIAESYGN